MTEMLKTTFFEQYDLRKSYESKVKQSSKLSPDTLSNFSCQISHLEQSKPFNLPPVFQALKI